MVVGAGVRVGTAGYLRCCVGGRWSLGLGVRAMSDFKVGDKIRRTGHRSMSINRPVIVKITQNKE